MPDHPAHAAARVILGVLGQDNPDNEDLAAHLANTLHLQGLLAAVPGVEIHRAHVPLEDRRPWLTLHPPISIDLFCDIEQALSPVAAARGATLVVQGSHRGGMQIDAVPTERVPA